MQGHDPFAMLKAKQKEGWALFAPMDVFSAPPAARLVRFAGLLRGQRVLDVGTGTGVVALTAAAAGAKAIGLDLSPDLLAKAKENAGAAGLDEVAWREGDVEDLPFRDGDFDVVLSQTGHMFAPRAQRATDEMLRVLRPGGTVAFTTWPPHFAMGRLFDLVARYAGPPPGDLRPDPPVAWGDPAVVRQRLGSAVRDLTFDLGQAATTALTPRHFVAIMERVAAPLAAVAGALQSDPARLEQLRRELEAVVAPYHQDNEVRLDYLMARATKV